MQVREICFILPQYPYNNEPIYTFARELICAIADQNVKCTVIAPQSITHHILGKRKKRPYHWLDYTSKGNAIDVFQPRYLSINNFKLFGVAISPYFNLKAAVNCFKKNNLNPDIMYGHFWHSGVIAGQIAKLKNIPLFVATGESRIWVRNLYSRKFIDISLTKITGIISVSTKNKNESLELGLGSKNQFEVIPNAINNNQFYKMDKNKIRTKFKIQQDEFVIAFTGAFTHRKGVERVLKAIDILNDKKIKVILIGSGDFVPSNNNIIFAGKVLHNEVATYLNAADVFVLPTLAEGCSNAIIEAMACGLPIISSNLPFNDDVLNSDNSIRINPSDVDEIAGAIKILQTDLNLRETLSEGSLLKAKELRMDNRVKKILDFINEMVN